MEKMREEVWITHTGIFRLHVKNQASVLEVMVVPENGRSLTHYVEILSY